MFYRAISLVLVVGLLHSSIAAQTLSSPTQSVAKMQQVLHKAQEKGKVVKVILNKEIDKQKKFSGQVSEISETGFVVIDPKTGKAMTLAYEDVKKVHQKGIGKGAKVAIIIGSIVGVFLIVWAAKGWFLFNRS
jgi:histidinol dehydrogenase